MDNLDTIAEARRQGAIAGSAAKKRDWDLVRFAMEYFTRWLTAQDGDRGMLQAEFDSAYRMRAKPQMMID